MPNNWKNKILNHEEAPPAGVWESIAGKLDQDNWQQRVLNHVETPPAGVWESIAGKLDQDKWQQRVLNHGETPPAGLWANIAASLDSEKEIRVVPVSRKSGKVIFWRIAAAACILSFILVPVFLVNRKADRLPANTAQVKRVDKKETGVPPVMDTNTIQQLPVAALQNETVAVVRKQNTNTGNKQAAPKPLAEEITPNIQYVSGNETVQNLAGDPSSTKTEKLTNIDGNAVNDIARMEPPNSYITITGPNGESIKVSSKFSKMINSITDRNPDSEEYIDKIIKESKFWKGKFKSWREKMTNNTLAPTPTNFMDVIELSKLVKE